MSSGLDSELWESYRRHLARQTQPAPTPPPPDVWKRMQQAQDWSAINNSVEGDIKSSIESMIQSHKNAIEGLETILALSNMAAATKNKGIERFVRAVIFGGLAAMRDGKVGDFG